MTSVTPGHVFMPLLHATQSRQPHRLYLVLQEIRVRCHTKFVSALICFDGMLSSVVCISLELFYKGFIVTHTHITYIGLGLGLVLGLGLGFIVCTNFYLTFLNPVSSYVI